MQHIKKLIKAIDRFPISQETVRETDYISGIGTIFILPIALSLLVWNSVTEYTNTPLQVNYNSTGSSSIEPYNVNVNLKCNVPVCVYYPIGLCDSKSKACTSTEAYGYHSIICGDLINLDILNNEKMLITTDLSTVKTVVTEIKKEYWGISVYTDIMTSNNYLLSCIINEIGIDIDANIKEANSPIYLDHIAANIRKTTTYGSNVKTKTVVQDLLKAQKPTFSLLELMKITLIALNSETRKVYNNLHIEDYIVNYAQSQGYNCTNCKSPDMQYICECSFKNSNLTYPMSFVPNMKELKDIKSRTLFFEFSDTTFYTTEIYPTYKQILLYSLNQIGSYLSLVTLGLGIVIGILRKLSDIFAKKIKKDGQSIELKIYEDV